MSTVLADQRRIPLRRMNVINGSRIGGVVTGSSVRPREYLIVCHQCGRNGGTLMKFAIATQVKETYRNAEGALVERPVEAERDVYYHAEHAPKTLLQQRAREQQLATGSGR